MELSQSTSMRMEQRQLLTPRMIQSMEILQMPLMALEERIEQELQSNPVLDIRDGDGETDFDANGDPVAIRDTTPIGESDFDNAKPLVVHEDSNQGEDFD